MQVAVSDSNLLTALREEVLAVIAKHVTIDPDKVEVRPERGKSFRYSKSRSRLPTHPPDGRSLRASGVEKLRPEWPLTGSRPRRVQTAKAGSPITSPAWTSWSSNWAIRIFLAGNDNAPSVH